MISTSIHNEKIQISNKYIDQNIKTHIINTLNEKLKNKCNLTHGYITDVNKIISIGDIIIKRGITDICETNVSMELNHILPTVNNIYKTYIKHIFILGIVFCAYNDFVIFVPKEKLVFSYSEDAGTYYDENKIQVVENENIFYDIKLTAVKFRYEKNNYNCIGTMEI